MTLLAHARATTAPLFALFTVLLAPSALAQMTRGNLIVVRVGDGALALSGASQAVFLDEYHPTGVLVQSFPMPTAAAGSNQAMTNSGTATSEGFLNLSEDGLYLVSGGYGAAPGTAAIAATTSLAVPRVIARTDLGGVTDTSTALTNAYSAGNIRSATSTDGINFWTAGNNGGIHYATLGATTSLQLNSTPLNTRVVSIFAGQLYTSSASATWQGVSMVGTGLPTTNAQSVTLLSGFPTATGPSSYDHFFASASTLYVADDRTNGGGGIQKWTESAGAWTLQYTLFASATNGCRGLSGVVNGGVATLFATTTGVSTIVTVTDAGAGSPFTTLATAGINTVFRGIRQVPLLGSVGRIANGCGTPTISFTGSGSLGSSVSTTLGNITGVPFMGLGLVIGITPICGTCSIGHDWLVALFGSTNVLNIPTNPSFLGVVIGIQGADVLGTSGCASPPVALTDTLVVTIS